MAYGINMTRGVTEISREIYNLHMTIFWISVAIGVIVFGVMFYALFYHRKSRGAVAAHFHEHPLVEIIWTIIPILILVAMAIPSTLLLIKMSDTEKDSFLSIKITGHQWRWEYEYLGKGIRFISNNATPQLQIQNKDIKNPEYLLTVDKPLVVPIGKKIRFLTTASDVIHSWWVPDLGIKKDAIPGFVNEAWAIVEKPGTYRGQCAELCGVNHAFMPIVLIAKTEDEFNTWMQSQLTPVIPQTPMSTPVTVPNSAPTTAPSSAPTSTPESAPSNEPDSEPTKTPTSEPGKNSETIPTSTDINRKKTP